MKHPRTAALNRAIHSENVPIDGSPPLIATAELDAFVEELLRLLARQTAASVAIVTTTDKLHDK